MSEGLHPSWRGGSEPAAVCARCAEELPFAAETCPHCGHVVGAPLPVRPPDAPAIVAFPEEDPELEKIPRLLTPRDATIIAACVFALLAFLAVALR